MISFPVKKFGLVFRLVELEDAAFIVGLRANTQLAKYVSHTDSDIGKQQKWIEAYKTREKEGKEYYFLFENNQGKQLGVVRLYNFNENTYTSGSWLISPESNDESVAFRSDLFAAYFAFEILKFEYCYIDVRKNNKKVLRYHKMYFKQVDEDDENVYLIMDRAAYEKKKSFLLSIFTF